MSESCNQKSRPAPWRAEITPGGGAFVVAREAGDDSSEVVLAQFRSRPGDYAVNPIGQETAKANAEFAVLAVNAHADLLAACEMADELAGCASYAEGPSFSPAGLAESRSRVEEILAVFREAIAKAKGVPAPSL